jgi:1-aminocyclopropane-1-carboxylate deaminase/D-cysteine desulfhydrase-like pyridoxal-dependent ACC family enzyme
VTLLAQRFHKLSSLAHLPLSRPTPVERLDGLSDESGSELWVKRDDLTADLYGGNKVRKLEFLLADARRRGCKSIVTTGAYGSHHVLATSLFGAHWNFNVHAVVVAQPWTPHVEENLRCVFGAGTEVHRASAWPIVATKTASLMAGLTARGLSPYWVPHGGSSTVGTLGYVEAGLEIAGQIDSGEIPEPSAIYVALGSGGTVAGLTVGLAALGFTTPVIGVRVTPRLVCNRTVVVSLINSTVRYLRNIDRSFPDVAKGAGRLLKIDSDHYGGGYGVVDAPTTEALKRSEGSGLVLDPTYTGKAFAAFLDAAGSTRHGRLLFWNTLSSADLGPLIEQAPSIPSDFR